MAKECECGGLYLTCDHSGGACQYCEDKDENHVVLRGQCIFCLFEGKEEWEDQWDSLEEVLDGIAFGVFKLGKKHGKSGKQDLVVCQTDDRNIKALYKLYKIGYKAGKNRYDELKKDDTIACPDINLYMNKLPEKYTSDYLARQLSLALLKYRCKPCIKNFDDEDVYIVKTWLKTPNFKKVVSNEDLDEFIDKIKNYSNTTIVKEFGNGAQIVRIKK